MTIFNEASFVDKFTAACRAVTVGDGLDPETRIGPLAHRRRLDTMKDFVGDALEKGAEAQAGGSRIGDRGYFPANCAH